MKLDIEMAKILAFNVANTTNALGKTNKSEYKVKLHYLLGYLLGNKQWLKQCTIDKINTHIKGCDSC